MARRAGMRQPTSADATKTTETTTTVVTSVADTPTSCDYKNRFAGIKAAKPNVSPIPSGNTPCRKIRRTMSPGVAPSAIRTPISCVRWLSAYAMTA